MTDMTVQYARWKNTMQDLREASCALHTHPLDEPYPEGITRLKALSKKASDELKDLLFESHRRNERSPT